VQVIVLIIKLSCARYMEPSQSYVLVVDQEANDIHILESLLKCLSCSVVVVNSAEQAMMFASQDTPYLVIWISNYLGGAHQFVHQLRDQANHRSQPAMMIVALTDIGAPSWLQQDENPGFDGFLVKPISGEILSSVVQSAWVRQSCLAMN
jgi:CheY-like chemotaxis protein